MLPLPTECPSCNHGNPAGSNYCNACGMPVGFRWCPQCDAVNKSSAPRCHKCGGALALQAPAKEEAAESGAPPERAPAVDDPLPYSASTGRRVSLRVAVTTVLLVAFAFPAYLTQQDFTPAPPLPDVSAAAHGPPAIEGPAFEPTGAAPAPSSEPPAPIAAPAPAKSARSSSAKAKQRSGTPKSRSSQRSSKAQSAARGAR